MQKKKLLPEYPLKPRSCRVRDVPRRQRPREMLERFGLGSVQDDVLLAVILRSGVRGVSVIDLSRQLLEHYGSLTAIARAPMEELLKVRGLGKIKVQVLKAALELARRLADESGVESLSVKLPAEVANIMREKARALEQETFWVLLLSTRNRLKCDPLEITRGLLDASLIHPREVFREAIQAAAAAVILVHNHPSGDPTPSEDDIRITRQLVKTGQVVDIRVLDHVILGQAEKKGGKDFFSMRETGIVEFM